MIISIIYYYYYKWLFQVMWTNYSWSDDLVGVNWGLKKNNNNFLRSRAIIVHTTVKHVIWRHEKSESSFEMYKNENCTYKGCKNTLYSCQSC